MTVRESSPRGGDRGWGWAIAPIAGAGVLALVEWGHRRGSDWLQIPSHTVAVLVVAVYGTAVWVAAYRGGMIGGAMATLLAAVYAAYAMLLPGRPLHGVLQMHFGIAMLAMIAPPLGFALGILARGTDVPRRPAPEPPRDATTILLARDPVSGVFSRGSIHRLAEQEFEAWRECARPVSFILLDVSRLRDINRAHGEDAGDRVLRILGGLLTDSLRPADRVGRFGADEFALVLPGTPIERAVDTGQSLIRTISQTPFPGNGHPLHIAVSLALAEPAPGDRSVDDVFARAAATLPTPPAPRRLGLGG